MEDFFDQAVRNNLRTYDNRKITTGQSDDYKAGCLLDYPYVEKDHKLIVTDLSKLPKLDADPKSIQQINFTGYLNRAGGATIFFFIEEAKETVKVL